MGLSEISRATWQLGTSHHWNQGDIVLTAILSLMSSKDASHWQPSTTQVLSSCQHNNISFLGTDFAFSLCVHFCFTFFMEIYMIFIPEQLWQIYHLILLHSGWELPAATEIFLRSWFYDPHIFFRAKSSYTEGTAVARNAWIWFASWQAYQNCLPLGRCIKVYQEHQLCLTVRVL